MRRTAIRLLAVAATLAILVSVGAVPAAAQTQSQSPSHNTVRPSAPHAADQIIVKFKSGIAQKDQLNVLTANGLKGMKQLRLTGAHLLHLARGADPETIAAALRRDPRVEYAEPDYLLQADALVSDPLFPNLWGMNNTGQPILGITGTPDVDIDTPEAWDFTMGSPSVVVAVIDTGVDTGHSDLGKNVWRNPGEVYGDGIDNDGNGFIDDVNGWDFYHNDSTVYDAADGDEHGTHVSGTIAAIANNGVGVVGVAPGVKIMPLKFLGPNGGYTSDAIEALGYAQRMGANLASNSWGGASYDAALHDAINAFGRPFVVAAGNDGVNIDASPRYPAAYDCANIISVAAVDNSGNLAAWSNYGTTSVDVGAPGVYIQSLKPGGLYQYMSGTSMATPHVSGIVALMLSLNPTLPTYRVVDLVRQTATPLVSLAGKTVSGGMANAFDALFAVGAGGPYVTATEPVNGARTVPLTQTLRVTFNEDVQPSAYYGSIALVDGTAGVPATCALSANTMTVTPTAGLVDNTNYTLVIPAGAVRNAAGADMAQPYELHFATPDTLPPVVVLTDPQDGATGVPVSQKVIIRFSEEVSQGADFTSITISDGATSQPITSYNWYQMGDSIVFSAFNDGFAYDTRYTVTLPSGAVLDQAGNALAAPYTFSFATEHDTFPPTVVASDPEPGATGVSQSKVVTVTFNEPVTEGPAFSSVQLTAGTVAVPASAAVSGSTLSITPVEKLAAGQTCTVTVPAGAVQDVAANSLASAISFSFTAGEFDVRELAFQPADAVADPDLPVVYMSSGYDGGVYALNYETGELRFLSLGHQPDALELGTGAYAGELYVAVHDRVPSQAALGTLPGWVYVIDRATFTVTDTITLGIDPWDVVAGRDGYIYVTAGLDQWTTFDSYDRKSGALVAQSTIRQQSYAMLHPKFERIYTIDSDVSPRDYTAYNIAAGSFTDPTYPGGYDSPYHGDYPLNINFRIDPLGRYLFNGSGVLFACTAEQTTDMTYVARLGTAFNDIAFDSDLARFYTTPTAVKAVYAYDGSTLQPLETYALADTAGRFLLKHGNTLLAFLSPTSWTPTYQSGIQVITLADPAPVVTATNPVDGATNVTVDGAISVTFSEPVAPGTQYGAVTVADAAGSPVPFTGSFSGGLLTLTPTAPLAYSTFYTVTVPAGAVEDATGNELVSTTRFSFTTAAQPDLTAPTLLSTDPADRAVDVATSQVISAVFSEPVIAGSQYGGIALTTLDGTAVAFSKDLAGSTLTLRPTVPLAFGTVYVVLLPTGAVQDAAGNQLQAATRFSFATEPARDLTPPTVVSTAPADRATNVAIGSTIQVVFSEPIQAGPGWAMVTVMKGRKAVTFNAWVSGNTLYIDPAADLAYNATYTVTLAEGTVQDQAGNLLATPYTFTFTTQKR